MWSVSAKRHGNRWYVFHLARFGLLVFRTRKAARCAAYFKNLG